MHGNVWEWCQDWWSFELPGGIAVDHQGTATGWLFDPLRPMRSGDWLHDAAYCRSANRYGDNPGRAYYNWGFRVVLAPGQP